MSVGEPGKSIISKSFAYEAAGGFSIKQSFPEIPIAEEFFVANALQIRLGVDTLNSILGITKDPSNNVVLEINYGETHSGEPHSGEPHSGGTHYGGTHYGGTHYGEPHSGGTHSGEPHCGETHCGETHYGEPHSGEPHCGETHCGETHYGGTHYGGTHSGEPHYGGTHSGEPHSSEPHSSETYKEYMTDTVVIKAEDLVKQISTDNIISMGSLSTLYSDFNYTILEYFGAPYGFSSIFAGEEHYNINNGVFDASALIHIINGGTFNFSGSYVSDLSGCISIHNMTHNIKKVCDNNLFGNRPPEKKYTYKDGFIENDLIYVKEGITIKLSVDIEAEPYAPIYNVGPSNLADIDRIYSSLNYCNTQTSVKKKTDYSLINITQIYTVPILIKLSNISDVNYARYGLTWTNITMATLADMNWLSCSISASGKYQTAVEESGSIYISSDYGVTWITTYNIGNAMTNCISMSHSGEYQTACNGEKIYISSDYGNIWIETYTFTNTDIFVCVSLSGKYQTVISQGDALYRSVNYGVSWTRYDNENSDIYNSIMAFPSAGISMSYDGRYQTIVSENIYLSKDYGETWVTTTILSNMDAVWDDHNWYGVDMSSDGKIQAAIEVNGEIYFSSDYGLTWTKVDEPVVTDIMWQAISISANGNCMTAVAKNGSIYYSVDSGVNWNKNPNPELDNINWSGVSVSSNALYQLACVYGGGLYASRVA